MPNGWIEKVYDRAFQTGMGWDTAKWKIYAIAKAPWGDSQKLQNYKDWGSWYPQSGEEYTTLKTIAPHGFIYRDPLIISETKATGSRLYVANGNYKVGDLVHANTVSGRPANPYVHKCVVPGEHNSTPKWATNPGGYSSGPSHQAPMFYNTGFLTSQYPIMGFRPAANLLNSSNMSIYEIAGNLEFRVKLNNPVAYDIEPMYPNVTWAPNTGYGYGIVYKIHRYLSDWAPEAQIWDSSDALTNRVIRRNGVLDCNDALLNIGTNNTKNMFLLMVRAAHNHADPDLPLTEQEVVAFWDHGRNIGDVYSTQGATGTILLSMSNMLQLGPSLSPTVSLSSTGALLSSE